MAEDTLMTEPAFVGTLATALRTQLPGSHVRYEPVIGDRYRFEIIWDQFNDVGHPERQDRVWDIVEQVVAKADWRKVAMILTIAMDELPEDENEGNGSGRS